MREKMEITTHDEHPPVTSQVTPGVDIYKNEDEIPLYADMPDVANDAIGINLENGRLTIKGHRSSAGEGEDLFEEFGEVQYERAFSVPQGIDINKVKAKWITMSSASIRPSLRR